jgi:hypothetical protein
MDITKFEIIILRHAFIQAFKRGITPDQIENAIRHGSIRRFGKNYVRFQTKTVQCIGEIAGLAVRIITVERRKK